ncbi:radical SAM protein [Candidatus Bathycorpusculum sp.]|uniref:radical SAM/SPASM domain-containing protein n=1 Tax=Candidatus Bathycorpusculum sp. TaxID=2994959 RepID=UPI00281B33C4|nr:radical SAM protein [Candidatus Termitimicrobium sp.]
MANFDVRQCHKWAQLLDERKVKLDHALDAIEKQDFDSAKKLVSQIFAGVMGGKQADPGMAGSLLYHMAMVTKMESETQVLLDKLDISPPDVSTLLTKIYGEFYADAQELVKEFMLLNFDSQKIALIKRPSSEEKIELFNKLKEQQKKAETLLSNKDTKTEQALEKLFGDWAEQVILMRLLQEYETIRGLLILSELVKTLGLETVETAMEQVQDKFGQETVNIALDVTLKVGMRREKLQAVMLSDHFINMNMGMENLDGKMEFLNCPIYGSHRFAEEKYGVDPKTTALFCRHFCFAHAKAMLDTVLPFPFTLWQPKRLASEGICEYYLKLAYSPQAQKTERFVPLVMSWNVTRECNLKCSHCYLNADEKKLSNELSTQEGKQLMDQIHEVSRPLLVLSGGEPMLRPDIFELIEYGAKKGIKMGLGSNGYLIDDAVAKKLKTSGIATVSISLDSHISAQHDEFRGVDNAWERAVNACKSLRKNNVLVQVNTTLTHENYNQIDDIMSLAESIGVENFHLFFLVPTGRGTKLTDISPQKYENMITTTFAKVHRHRLNVRPSCAPQFMRIAQGMNMDMRQWIRGCIAGMYYCRIYPNGDVTPCPYMPIKLGNVREQSFKDIWFNSEIFKNLRNPNCLKGKCGACEYKIQCGGCRARAYGLSSDFIDYCGDLHVPSEQKKDYLAEDPWCVYQPKNYLPLSKISTES